jgi:hypothetical protein
MFSELMSQSSALSCKFPDKISHFFFLERALGARLCCSRATQKAWFFLVLACLAGCGGPKLYPVTGKVVYPDGSPMKGGAIVFETNASKDRVMAQGAIDIEDGTFALGTKEEGDGAPEGVYRVAIRGRRNNPHAKVDDPELEDQIHPRFQSFENSKLEFTVAPKPNEFVIKIERAPKVKSSLPSRPQ